MNALDFLPLERALDMSSANEVALALGVNRRHVMHWRSVGLTEDEAVDLAEKAGVAPGDVWPALAGERSEAPPRAGRGRRDRVVRSADESAGARRRQVGEEARSATGAARQVGSSHRLRETNHGRLGCVGPPPREVPRRWPLGVRVPRAARWSRRRVGALSRAGR